MSSNDNDQGQNKKLRGFAAHPENINRDGRPKGSRNKSSLLQAQLQLDGATEQAAEFLQAVMTNDTEAVGLKEGEQIPIALRISAAKEILNKAIANEKDKDPVEEKTKANEKPKPKFSPRAVTNIKKNSNN